MRKFITMGLPISFLLLAGNSFGQQKLQSTPSETVKSEPKTLEKNAGNEQAKSLNTTERITVSKNEPQRRERTTSSSLEQKKKTN